MQVMYQVQEDASKPIGLGPLSSSAPTAAHVPTVYQAYPERVSETKKANNQTYDHKLIYSPYLAPSHLIIEQQIDRNGVSPIYMQNIARTKYAMISQVHKPQDNKSLNVVI